LSCRSYTWTYLHYRGLCCTWKNQSCVPKLVCTTEVCTRTFLHTGHELHVDLSTLYHYRGPCASWTCLQQSSQNSTRTCLQYRGLCSIWMCLHHRGLNTWTYSGPQMHVLHLDLSTPQGYELHLYVSRQQEPFLLLDLSTLQGMSCT
jgi:hypothetical protein